MRPTIYGMNGKPVNAKPPCGFAPPQTKAGTVNPPSEQRWVADKPCK